jgi:leucyl-tRNA synthetase
MEDAKQTGELIADVRNLVLAVQKYNGQIAQNNKDITELRVSHSRTLEQIINIQEEYRNSQKLHEDQIKIMEKLTNSNRRLTYMVWVNRVLAASVVAFVLFIPKIAPSWTPFGDSLKVNDVKVLIEENSVSEEEVKRIVDDALSNYQTELVN